MSAILKNIVVAIDGSENSRRAVTFALTLARRHTSELVFCSVVDRAVAIAECSTASVGGNFALPLLQALDQTANSLLADAAQRASDAGVVATTVVLDGQAVQSIVAFAKRRNADAIVMGTQGKRKVERFFLGSTADGVLRRSDQPVFVIPPGVATPDRAFGRILVAVDESDSSRAAVAFALELAAADSAQVVFCGVAETVDLLGKAATYGYDPRPILAELHAAAAATLALQTARAQELNVAYESVVAAGDPAKTILETAQAQHADVIVVGTHGRRGLRRLFAGSVAETVVCRSAVPVVVIRTAPHLRASDTIREAVVEMALP